MIKMTKIKKINVISNFYSFYAEYDFWNIFQDIKDIYFNSLGGKGNKDIKEYRNFIFISSLKDFIKKINKYYKYVLNVDIQIDASFLSLLDDKSPFSANSTHLHHFIELLEIQILDLIIISKLYTNMVTEENIFSFLHDEFSEEGQLTSIESRTNISIDDIRKYCRYRDMPTEEYHNFFTQWGNELTNNIFRLYEKN